MKRSRISYGSAATGSTNKEVDLALSSLHDKAWGKRWPRSKGTICKAEMTDSESGPADGDVDDVDQAIADTSVPEEFTYWFMTGMRDIKKALNATSDMDDVLVICDEFEQLYNLLERREATTQFRGYVVTGQPGIGSYECWF